MPENTPALIDLEERILKLLRESPNPLSTYEIAKALNVSWSTANTHLKDLQLKGLVKSKEEFVKTKRRKVWWVDQVTIEKFTK